MDDYWLGKWRKTAKQNIEKKVEKLADEYALPYDEALTKDYNSIEYQTAMKNICEGGVQGKIGFEGGSWTV